MERLDSLLKVESISKTFKSNKGAVAALKPTSIELHHGEILGIIGESGSGKSTLLKLLAGIEQTQTGYIRLLGNDITHLNRKESKYIYQQMQMVFQNAVASFNPRQKIRKTILENMKCLRPSLSLKECNEELDQLLERVSVSPELVNRYPHQLSGGQCQRIAIARALVIQPKILLCDEITSALDVLVQADVIELLKKLNKELGITIIFVSHGLSLTCKFCTRVMVMKSGECVEEGTAEKIAKVPEVAYTKTLMNSSKDLLTIIERRNQDGANKICQNESQQECNDSCIRRVSTNAIS